MSTWPGARVGPETVCTVAPVSSRDSAIAGDGPDRRSHNARRQSARPGREAPIAKLQSSKKFQTPSLQSCRWSVRRPSSERMGRPFVFGFRNWDLVGVWNLELGILQLPRFPFPSGIRNRKSDTTDRIESLLLLQAMPVPIVVTMFQRQLEEFLFLLFAALGSAAARLDFLRPFEQRRALVFQRLGARRFEVTIEVFLTFDPGLQTN